MKIRTAIQLENFDLADANHLRYAFNLVGIEYSDIDDKSFRRIFGNDFTVENAREAVEIVAERRKHLYEAEPIFCNERLQARWEAGIRANADRALRYAEEFLENLMEDLRTICNY